MLDLKELGQQIASLRKQQGDTQADMANDLHISRATLNALENGRCNDIGIQKVSFILDYVGKELLIKDKSPFPTFEELIDAKNNE